MSGVERTVPLALVHMRFEQKRCCFGPLIYTNMDLA